MYGFLSGPPYKLSTGEIKLYEEKLKNSIHQYRFFFFFTKDGIDRCFQTSEAYRVLYFSWINNLPPVEIITIAILIIFLYFKKYICKIGYSRKLLTKYQHFSSIFFFLHKLSGKRPICLVGNHGFARKNSYFCKINPSLLFTETTLQTPVCPGLLQRDFCCEAPSELMAVLKPSGPSSAHNGRGDPTAHSPWPAERMVPMLSSVAWLIPTYCSDTR